MSTRVWEEVKNGPTVVSDSDSQPVPKDCSRRRHHRNGQWEPGVKQLQDELVWKDNGD